MNGSAYKLFFLSLLVLIAFASGTGYLIYQQEKVGREIQERLADRKAWDNLAAVEGDLTSNREGTEGLQDQLRSLALLSEADTIQFLAHVEEVAKSSGVSVATIELTEEKISDPNFNELSATFSLRGESGAVERTIELFEVLPYRSRIERLTFTRGEVTSEAQVVIRVSTIK